MNNVLRNIDLSYPVLIVLSMALGILFILTNWIVIKWIAGKLQAKFSIFYSGAVLLTIAALGLMYYHFDIGAAIVCAFLAICIKMVEYGVDPQEEGGFLFFFYNLLSKVLRPSRTIGVERDTRR